MNTLFLNDHGRLRSGWRAGIFVFAFVFFYMGWGIFGEIITSISLLGIGRDSLLLWVADLFISFALATILGWILGKTLEGLPIKTLGWAIYRGWFRDIILGLVIGAATLVFACLICAAFGRMSFTLNDSAGTSAIGLTLIVSAMMFIVGAAAEEAMFRGYLLQTFTRANLAWLAIIFTSIFFASAHLSNPNFSLLAMINTLLAGLWFSAAYLKTRSLWLPFAAHFTWNWFQGAIFGIPVSGITRITTAPVLQPVDSGPQWLTGGSYGIEGGIACTIALLLSTALIWFLPALKADAQMLKLTSKENPLQVQNGN
jgi:membrane protease YdiL (CAAX protease family)